MVTAFNILAYKSRYGGAYKRYLNYFGKNKSMSLGDLRMDQKKRFENLVLFSLNHSKFYKEKYRDIEDPEKIENIRKLPIISKEEIRSNIQDIYTIAKRDAVISKTGGTTGKSLKVFFTKDNTQERFAMLDNFRGQFGYELGKRTAWFSGKKLLVKRDIKKNRFWKTDLRHKVRYYSTFNINSKSIPFYIKDLLHFKPEYLVGFPSNLYDIAKYGDAKNIEFQKGLIKAIFPTAETLTHDQRNMIESYFHAPIYDQYASSEGGPFIFECNHRNLHLELQSGVFEVLSENNEPVKSGRLILTSFTTYGTPLIRYDIGDNLELSDKNCNCGNENPLVNKIMGREDDFIYSPDHGKINLGNISNTTKGAEGIIKFQVLQNDLNGITILLVRDLNKYSKQSEKKYLQNWRDRVGNTFEIRIEYVDEIPKEASGKYRIVKNNIKSLIDL
jgi:phenylacetate-CoA ligase